jgi:hypothetical protein
LEEQKSKVGFHAELGVNGQQAQERGSAVTSSRHDPTGTRVKGEIEGLL